MKKLTFLFLIALFSYMATDAQVAINTDGSAANASAMLDIKSDTAGLLIPRMTATQRDAIKNPAQGLMVFVTGDSTFYYYKNTSWEELATGKNAWTVIGDSVYCNRMARVGIGTTTPMFSLDIENHNKDSITIFLSDTNSDAFQHYGYYGVLTGTGTGSQTGIFQGIDTQGGGDHATLFTWLSGSGSGDQMGLFQIIDNDGSGTHYGSYNLLYGSGAGQQYGSYDTISNSGDAECYGAYHVLTGTGGGFQYGVFNNLSGSTDGQQLGTVNYIDNSGNLSDHSGVINYLRGSGTGDQYGTISMIDNSGTGKHYGEQNQLSGSGSGEQTGIDNEIENTGDATHYGVYNKLSGTASGDQFGTRNDVTITGDAFQYGVYNYLAGYGTGWHYGTNNYISGSGAGPQCGSYTRIDNSGNDPHFGTDNYLTGTGSGKKYGTYDTIPESAGGTHYGVYSCATGNTNYAGYFNGNVKMTQKLKAPLSGDADLKAYIYGSLKNDGTTYSNESTTGFTSEKLSTGVYKITFTNYNSDKHYLVLADALQETSPAILTYAKDWGSFTIHAWNLSGAPVDTYLNFVVYRK